MQIKSRSQRARDIPVSVAGFTGVLVPAAARCAGLKNCFPCLEGRNISL